jgi:hypothetical protein
MNSRLVICFLRSVEGEMGREAERGKLTCGIPIASFEGRNGKTNESKVKAY